MAGVPDVILTPPLHVGMVSEVRSVNSSLGVRSQGVCYQITQARMEDKDGRIWSEKQVGVGAVGLERCLGTDDNS